MRAFVVNIKNARPGPSYSIRTGTKGCHLLRATDRAKLKPKPYKILRIEKISYPSVHALDFPALSGKIIFMKVIALKCK